MDPPPGRAGVHSQEVVRGGRLHPTARAALDAFAARA
jgi:hypothetical protein